MCIKNPPFNKIPPHYLHDNKHIFACIISQLSKKIFKILQS